MFQLSFQSLLRKQTGKRAMWEYPFAVAGVNITFMILKMLDLDASKSTILSFSVHLTSLFRPANVTSILCSKTTNSYQGRFSSDVVR